MLHSRGQNNIKLINVKIIPPLYSDYCLYEPGRIEVHYFYAYRTSPFKADSHIACHAHAVLMLFTCHAVLLRVQNVSFAFDLHSAAVSDSHLPCPCHAPFLQVIYTLLLRQNYVPREYRVPAILLLLFMVLMSLVSVLNILY